MLPTRPRGTDREQQGRVPDVAPWLPGIAQPRNCPRSSYFTLTEKLSFSVTGLASALVATANLTSPVKVFTPALDEVKLISKSAPSLLNFLASFAVSLDFATVTPAGGVISSFVGYSRFTLAPPAPSMCTSTTAGFPFVALVGGVTTTLWVLAAKAVLERARTA